MTYRGDIPRSSSYYIGVDIGQTTDFTAICVLKKVEISAHVVHLERLALGTPYPKQVARVSQIMKTVRMKNDGAHPRLIIDRTGAGDAVVALFRHEKMDPIALTITGGGEVNKEKYNAWYIPKRELISSLVVAFQKGHIQIAKALPEADTLIRELTNFTYKVPLRSGNDTYEEWREGVHDDLVFSVAMAVYAADIGTPKMEGWMVRRYARGYGGISNR